ncbi:hypothetical protein DFJ74DRAFT_679519 [Hyaloraphidium curvatum]|nr:hypothetical protein DFJ74DRAFT_679519 [Hyaloraphidium curvatum]
MATKFGGAPTCPRCSKAVYMAEQVVAPGGPYHKNCLTCLTCSKRIDSTTLAEREGQVYCKACYGKNWGPRGYGFAGGGAFLNPEPVATGSVAAPRSGSPVRASPTTPASAGSNGSTDSTLSADKERTSGGKVQAKVLPGIGGGGSTCPGCSKTVYFAEQVIGPQGAKFHKLCLKCTSCSKLLETSTISESKDGIVCKSCYAKTHGPKGYGFAAGGAGLMSA